MCKGQFGRLSGEGDGANKQRYATDEIIFHDKQG